MRNKSHPNRTKIMDKQKLMRENERLNALLEMVGETAHELNQPLTVLMCKVEILSVVKDDPEKMDSYLKAIHKAGSKISSIVQKIQNIRSHDTKSMQVTQKL
jgi:signal transduction histidine kinase